MSLAQTFWESFEYFYLNNFHVIIKSQKIIHIRKIRRYWIILLLWYFIILLCRFFFAFFIFTFFAFLFFLSQYWISLLNPFIDWSFYSCILPFIYYFIILLFWYNWFFFFFLLHIFIFCFLYSLINFNLLFSIYLKRIEVSTPYILCSSSYDCLWAVIRGWRRSFHGIYWRISCRIFTVRLRFTIYRDWHSI